MTPHDGQDQATTVSKGQTQPATQTTTRRGNKAIAPATVAATTQGLGHGTATTSTTTPVSTTTPQSTTTGYGAGHAATTEVAQTPTKSQSNDSEGTKHEAKALPETGQEDHSTELLAGIASVLGLGGLATLFARRRKSE